MMWRLPRKMKCKTITENSCTGSRVVARWRLGNFGNFERNRQIGRLESDSDSNQRRPIGVPKYRSLRINSPKP